MKLNFLCKKKFLARCVLCYENKLAFPIYISYQEFENWMNFLLVTEGKKSHYMYIKGFNRFMFLITKNKNK